MLGRAAKAQTYLGMCLSDRCDYERAQIALSTAIATFDSTRQRGWQGYAEAMLARAIERSGDPIGGAAMAETGLEHVRRGSWRAVLPWPMLVLANCALATGDRDSASIRYSEALTYAIEIGDPCYEALALRGLGLLSAPQNLDAAIRLLTDGLTCCRRYQDVYPWVRAVILADLVELQHGADARVLDEASELAALGPLPDLAERLATFRGRSTRSSQNPVPDQTPFQTAAT